MSPGHALSLFVCLFISSVIHFRVVESSHLRREVLPAFRHEYQCEAHSGARERANVKGEQGAGEGRRREKLTEKPTLN